MTFTTAMTLAGPAACTRDVSLLPGGSRGDDAAPAIDAHADAVAVEVAVEVGAAPDGGGTSKLCAGLGDPIRLPTATGLVCASALAARAGRFALCSCNDLQITAPIHTDSFDSGLGASGAGSTAAIGVDGVLTSSAEILVGGALYVSSGIATTRHIDTARSFRVGSSVVIITEDIHVAGDAFIAGSVSGLLRVDGALHLPSGVGIDPASMIPEASIHREPVSVPRPCDCSAAAVDLDRAIASALATNDNAVVGLSMDLLSALKVTTAVNVTCGTYVLSAIDAQQPLIFTVRGRALLVVTGDVALRGGLIVSLDPGAELDLLVGGRLMASGGNAIGSDTPARFRIWVAGTASVIFDDAPSVGAMIRAPNAAVTASSGLLVTGGLLAGSVIAGGELDLHLDEAVFSSGMLCGEPAATFVP